MKIKYNYIAAAVVALAGHQTLVAGYRVIDGRQEVQQVAPEVVNQSPAASTGVTPTGVDPSLVSRIRALEAENALLRSRLREAESIAEKQRPRASDADDSAAFRFNMGSTKLNASAARKAELVKRAKHASAIEIVGYTDNTGNEEINKRIALARAELVKGMLVSSGISPEIIKVSEKAGVYLSTNETVEGRALNRRAIVTFK